MGGAIFLTGFLDVLLPLRSKTDVLGPLGRAAGEAEDVRGATFWGAGAWRSNLAPAKLAVDARLADPMPFGADAEESVEVGVVRGFFFGGSPSNNGGGARIEMGGAGEGRVGEADAG
jgi:hypothetical protein